MASRYSLSLLLARAISRAAVLGICLALACYPLPAASQQSDIESRSNGDGSCTVPKSDPATFIYKPLGTKLVSIPAGGEGSEEIALLQPIFTQPSAVEHVFVMLHGKLSDAGVYWDMLNQVVVLSSGWSWSRNKRQSVTVAPLLYSDSYTPDLHTGRQLSWATADDWQSGRPANHPAGTSLTSIDALDALIDRFSDKARHPRVTNITVVGHSAGGQLVQRYAAIGREGVGGRGGVHVRYVHNNPSTNSYFTAHRPVLDDRDKTVGSCPDNNTWKYGFEGFPGTAEGLLPTREYFRRYVSRDVVSTVGYRDTDPCSGNQDCEALVQGGRTRRDRNLLWYKYIHELARRGRVTDRFPGVFGGGQLPDWSDEARGGIRMRLTVVEESGHEFPDVFSTETGRSALFDDVDVAQGWRP